MALKQAFDNEETKKAIPLFSQAPANVLSSFVEKQVALVPTTTTTATRAGVGAGAGAGGGTTTGGGGGATSGGGVDDDDVKKAAVLKQQQQESSSSSPPMVKVEPPKVSTLSLLSYSTTKEKWLMVLGIICATISGLGLPAWLVLLARSLDKFNAIGRIISQFGIEGVTDLLRQQLNNLVMGFAFVGVVSLISGSIYVSLWTYTGECQSLRIKQYFVQSVITQDASWFDSNQREELPTKIANAMIHINSSIGRAMVDTYANCIAALGCLSVAMVLNAPLALIMLCVVPVVSLVVAILGYFIRKKSKQSATNFAIAGAIATESISGIKTVASLCAEDWSISNYSNFVIGAERTCNRGGILSSLAKGLTGFLFYMTYTIAFIIGTEQVARNTSLQHIIKCIFAGDDDPTCSITGATVMCCIYGVILCATFFGLMSPGLQCINLGRQAAVDIFATIRRVPHINPNSTNLGQKLKEEELEHKGCHITLQNVHFHYPSRPNNPIFYDFNLDIKAGTSVALVGPSGSGKSTISRLLLRFYDPQSGHLLINNVKLTELNVKWWRSKIGYVAQEPTLFPGTIGYNIACGYSSSLPITTTSSSSGGGEEDQQQQQQQQPTQEQIEQAARDANAHEFIKSFPNGYDTFYSGASIQLSGGQMQRICIARALIRNPAILLLDEATSALDTNSERQVQNALEYIRSKKRVTTVTVAHRLSTIMNCDAIAVIANGSVRELGTHEELLNKNGGIYQNLCESQGILPNDGGKKDTNNNNNNNNNKNGNVGGEGEGDYSNGSKKRVVVNTQQEEKEGAEEEKNDNEDDNTQKGISPKSITAFPQQQQHENKLKDEKKKRNETTGTIITQDIETGNVTTTKATTTTMTPQDVVKPRTTTTKEQKKDDNDNEEDDEEEEEEEEIAEWSRLLSLNKSEWFYLLLGIFGAFIVGALSPSEAILTARIVSNFYTTSSTDEMRQVNLPLSLAFLILASASVIGNLCMGIGFSISGYRLTRRMRIQMYECIITRPMYWFDIPKHSTGELITRLESDAESVSKVTGWSLGYRIQVVSTLLAGIFISLYFAWPIGVIAICCVPLIMGAAIVQASCLSSSSSSSSSNSSSSSTNYQEETKSQEKEGKLNNDETNNDNDNDNDIGNTLSPATILEQGLRNITSVQAYDLQSKICTDYSTSLQPSFQGKIKLGIISGLVFGFSQFAIFVSFAILFYVGAQLLVQQKVDFAQFFTSILAVMFGAIGIAQVNADFNAQQDGLKAAARIFKIIDGDDDDLLIQDDGESSSSSSSSSLHPFSKSGKKPNEVVGNIQFNNCTFAYPTRPERYIYYNSSTRFNNDAFTLTIPQKQSVAFVGKSGCGKSTALQILLRFYNVNSGNVTLDNVNISELNVKWLRTNIGYVGQQPVLFAGTVKENILLGSAAAAAAAGGGNNVDDDDGSHGNNKTNPVVTEEQMIDAARAANAHEFITNLPNGYETDIGTGGSLLSGGQKQRIAIARAIIKNPAILVLDEATSALDNKSEYIVQNALDNLQLIQPRTTLVVAHRLVTVQKCNLIAVLDDGGVKELGNHEELLNLKGLYYELWSKQSSSSSSSTTSNSTDTTTEDKEEEEEEEQNEKKNK